MIWVLVSFVLAVILAVVVGIAWYLIVIALLVLAIVGMLVWFSNLQFFN